MTKHTSPIKPLIWEQNSSLPYQIIAGPCSAETEAQTLETAQALARLGITTFRASLWKPRTRPGGFEGVGAEGIPWLRRIREELGLEVATEVGTAQHIEAMLEAGLKTFWIGARTTASPFAVSELAESLRGVEGVTIWVKNPINPDIELWEGALLRFVSAGISNLGAIHRGFSTYGPSVYRNSPLWQIPLELCRRHPELTMLVDPSHIGGRRELIEPLSRLALELGMAGLIIETHPRPDEAWSDSRQQLSPEELGAVLSRLGEAQDKQDLHLMDALRREIDNIDEHLLTLLAERMTLAGRIGRYKSLHQEPILQPKRYHQLLEQRRHLGLELGLEEELITQLFEAIHSSSVRLQEGIKTQN